MQLLEHFVDELLASILQYPAIQFLAGFRFGLRGVAGVAEKLAQAG